MSYWGIGSDNTVFTMVSGIAQWLPGTVDTNLMTNDITNVDANRAHDGGGFNWGITNINDLILAGSGNSLISFGGTGTVSAAGNLTLSAGGTADLLVNAGQNGGLGSTGFALIAQGAPNFEAAWIDLATFGFITSIIVGNSTFIDLVDTGSPTVPDLTASLSATGIPDATTFLRGDNTWSAPIGTVYTANNGMNLAANNFQLGGPLVEIVTDIDMNSNTLNIFDGNLKLGIIGSPLLASFEIATLDADWFFTDLFMFGAGITPASLKLQPDTGSSELVIDTGGNHSGVGIVGDVLINQGLGVLEWVAPVPTIVYTADNGLTETANNFQLGGTLILPLTTILGGSNDFHITDVDDLFIRSNVLTRINSATESKINVDGTNGAEIRCINTGGANTEMRISVGNINGALGVLDDILINQGSGVVAWGASNTYDNGLTKTLNNIQLGGPLIETTTDIFSGTVSFLRFELTPKQVVIGQQLGLAIDNFICYAQDILIQGYDIAIQGYVASPASIKVENLSVFNDQLVIDAGNTHGDLGIANDILVNQGAGVLAWEAPDAIGIITSRVIVKQASDFGVIDSTKQYFLDGIIDMGLTSIEVPATGIQVVGLGFDISGLITSDPGAVIFTSPIGGSGNIVITDILIENTGVGSKTFDVFDATGFHGIEISRVNFNNCVSLGEIDNYRQGLENGTGRFGGTPELLLTGVWVGGYLATSTITRSLVDGAYFLFRAGLGFSMASRFKTDMNVDLNVTVGLTDFTPAMFPNPSSVQLENMLVTRLGVFNSADLTIMPNMLPSDLSSSWTNNQGLRNTFVGGVMTLTVEVVTPIALQNVSELLLGTFTPSDLQHFDNPLQYQLRNLGNSPTSYTVDFNFVLIGAGNELYEIDLVVDDGGGPVIVFNQKRYVVAAPGPNDLGQFSGSHNVTLNNTDIVYWQIKNIDSATGCTLQLDSTWDVRQR